MKLDGSKKYILLADDHPIVLSGLKEIVNVQPDLEVIGTARNSKELMTILDAVEPSLLVLDLGLARADGLELLKSIRARHAKIPVLVFSMHDEKDFALRAISAGAAGYVMKDHADDHLLQAIRAVLGGQIFMSEAVRRAQTEALSTIPKSGVDLLTDREFSIFRMIGQGSSTRAIAQDLGISVKTVEKHRENIKRKLSLQDGSKLASEAAIYLWRTSGGQTLT